MTQGEDELMRSPSSQGTDPDEFKPDTPTMGSIEQTGIGTWNVWTGGVPNNQWTGLLKSTPSHISPSQYRPTSVTSQAKSRAYQVAGPARCTENPTAICEEFLSVKWTYCETRL